MIEIPVYLRGRVSLALVDDDFAEFGSYRWYNAGGYAVRYVPRGSGLSESMHRQVLGLVKGDPRVVHHVNENALDNRRENLEVCESRSEANSRPHPKRDAAPRRGSADVPALAADRISLLELDVDTRLTPLWAQMPAGADVETLAPWLRAAYALGYCEALAERERGRLCWENGYKTPRRRVA